MGELIIMPARGAEQTNKPQALPVSGENQIDFSVWQTAPKERTAAYFPTYSAVSRAMQSAMRGWVRGWVAENPEVLLRPHTAYPILVYQCTHPFAGKPSNVFTYDIQQTDVLNRAFASAASKLGRELRRLNTKRFDWFTREHYFTYRGKEVVKYVAKNPRAIYRMLHVETMLMDAILRFAIIDLPVLGMDQSLVKLRRSFKTQLHRFSEQFDLSPHAEDLLAIATNALVSKMAAEAEALIPLAA